MRSAAADRAADLQAAKVQLEQQQHELQAREQALSAGLDSVVEREAGLEHMQAGLQAKQVRDTSSPETSSCHGNQKCMQFAQHIFNSGKV